MDLRFGAIMAVILSAVAANVAMSGVPAVSPVTALALFTGAYLADRKLAMMVPVVAMLLGDLVLGMHNIMFFTYGAFILIALIGMFIAKRLCGHVVIAASLASSALFFLVTNFGVWMVSGYYPMTFEGLLDSYAAAIPFFQMILMGDLFFVGILFGLFMMLEHYLPAMRRPTHNV